ncbi:putative endo-beta-1,4-glucanase D [Paramyrothecium foliicola]|nr:putative endo-beta-1,4-glucanase D [Paramyrothecium foliicola]
MKHFSILTSLALAASVQGHAILQVGLLDLSVAISVNGQNQGQLTGLRAPNNNNPVQNVNSNDIVCGQSGYTNSKVITVPAGARVGHYWQHVLGGPQFPGDADNPIAASHKGPITAWLAKVSNAASSSHQGLQWFKIAEDNLDTNSGLWGVDRMLQGGGWHYFNVPQCIAPGQYLLRIELLALHSAGSSGGAQFYGSCAQIQVTGSGNFNPSQTVSLPGAYKQNDPSIQISIYGNTGKPDNNKRAYQAPGPRPISC